jgi:acyl-coenzyme A synthetase/AMP-(fatty) acid ligase
VASVFNAATFFVDRHLAEGRGAGTAHRFRERSVTWAEVAGAADRWGNALADFDVGIGARVLIVSFVAELPRTATGKIQRFRLRTDG